MQLMHGPTAAHVLPLVAPPKPGLGPRVGHTLAAQDRKSGQTFANSGKAADPSDPHHCSKTPAKSAGFLESG